jgi:hypothetical protein
MVKAIGCEAFYQTGALCVGARRRTSPRRRARALSKPISPSTVGRMVDTDAIKPWLFPRPPNVRKKLARPWIPMRGSLALPRVPRQGPNGAEQAARLVYQLLQGTDHAAKGRSP